MGRVAVAKDKPKDCMEDRVILRPRKLDCDPPGAPFREPPKPPFVAVPEAQLKTASRAGLRIVLRDRPEDRAEQSVGNRVED